MNIDGTTIKNLIPADGWHFKRVVRESRDDGGPFKETIETRPLIGWALVEHYDYSMEQPQTAVVGLANVPSGIRPAPTVPGFAGYTLTSDERN